VKYNTNEIFVNDIDCKEAVNRLMDYLDHYLNDQHEMELEKHLASCKSCLNRYEFQKMLKEKINSLTNECDPSFANKLKGLLDSL
jgi:anti-sigma factor (TIGR02949 family)